jgi:tetratricopeptide (TPR) repeat protein
MNLIRQLLLAAAATLLVACGSPEDSAAEYLAKAEQLYEDGDIVGATLEVKNAVQIEPKNAAARLLMAKILKQEGKIRAAVFHLLIAVESDPDDVESRVQLGTYYFMARATERAREQANAALKLDPGNAGAQLLDARVRFLEEDRAGALSVTDRALELDPGLVDAIMFKAGMLSDLDGFDAAFEAIDAGIANVSLEDGEPLRQFRLQLLHWAGQDDQLEAELQALAVDFPDDEDYKISLARWYVFEERYAEAESVMLKLVEDSSEDTGLKIKLVSLLGATKGFEAAEAALRDFIDENPDNLQLGYSLGELYEANGRVEEANTAYQQLGERAPLSPEGLQARNRLVALKLATEEFDADEFAAARELNAAILTDDPENVTALYYRAMFSYMDQDFDGVTVDLRLALRYNESFEPAMLLLARANYRMGKSSVAQEGYRRLLAIDPGHEQAAGELAALLRGQGDSAEAEVILRGRLEADPDDPQATAALVQTLLAQQDYDAAESEARRLSELNSDNALAQFQLGQVMRARGFVSEAVAAYKLALEEDPQATDALRDLITLLVQNNRAPEAFEFLQGYLVSNPDQPDALYLLGSLHATHGSRDTATDIFETLLVEYPTSVQTWVARARMEPGASKARLSIYERGLEAIPDDETLTLLIASILEAQERFDEAMVRYESLLAAHPDNAIATNNLASLLLEHGNNDSVSYARALKLAKKFESAEQPIFADTAGWAYYKNGDYDRAVQLLERAVASAGEFALMRYHLGMAYAKNNNPVGAKQELNQALELATADFVGIDEARATLAELEAS